MVQVVPTYTMSCFLIPKGLCEEIEGMIRNFWWERRKEEKKIAWVSWEKMCKAKSNGGMGLCNFQAFNLAMLAKQRWRLLSNPDSLCVKLFVRCCSFSAFNGNFSHKKKKKLGGCFLTHLKLLPNIKKWDSFIENVFWCFYFIKIKCLKSTNKIQAINI